MQDLQLQLLLAVQEATQFFIPSHLTLVAMLVLLAVLEAVVAMLAHQTQVVLVLLDKVTVEAAAPM
jgi:hypothetical protein